MKKRGTFFMNIKNGLCSVNFVLAVIGIAILCYVSVLPYLSPKEFWSEDSMLFMFDMLIGISTFKKILVILAATPFAASFCNDWNSRFMNPVVIRSGIKNYIWSKVIVCAVTGLITVFLGLTLFMSVMSIWIPLFPQDISISVFPPFDEIVQISPYLYLAVNMFIFSLGCAFWTVIGLTISAFLPNYFVAIITPFIASYVLEDLTKSMTPPPINLYDLTRVSNVIEQGAVISFLYYLFIFSAFIFALGLLFSYQVKRRIRNEVT